MGIKNIIFDLGNVIIDLDTEETARRLKRVFNIDYDFFKEKMSQCFLDYEIGKLTESEFVQALVDQSPTAISELEVIEHWNSMLIDIPEQRLDMLRELSQSYNVFIFSNTNFTHISWVTNFLKQRYGKSTFEDWGVRKAYFSHELGARKPNSHSYERLLKLENLQPRETLFIDDHPSNVQAAKDLGILSVLHFPTKEITEEIRNYLSPDRASK